MIKYSTIWMDAITSRVPDYENCGQDLCSLPRRRPFEAWRSGYLRTIGGNCQDKSIRLLQEGIPPQSLSWKSRLHSRMDLSSCFSLFFNICRLSSHTQKRSWELRFHWPKGRQLNQCCLWSVKTQELFSFFLRPLKKVQSEVPSIFSNSTYWP